MVSEKFRHQLRKEVDKWQAEGLIDAELYEQLAHRYQFSALDTAARNRFVLILLGLGSVLLGLAVITFVAANWQVWSRELKVVLLMSLFAGVNAAGFYLWRRPVEGWQFRLGMGLLLLGALILGANLALMSQMFHQSGPVYQLYLVWALGVLAMAYSLRLTLLAILAVILTGIGYSWGIPDLLSPGEFSGFQLSLQHMPLLASLLFVPLAYWCRSRWLFGLGTVLVISSLEVNLLRQLEYFYGFSPATGGVIVAIACCLPPALLWAYSDSLWIHRPSDTTSFDPIARNLAVFFLSILFYQFSFHFFWEYSPYQTVVDISWRELLTLPDVLVFGGLTLWAWWRLGYRAGSPFLWQIDLHSTVVGAMIAITAFVVWWQVSVGDLEAIATFIFNVLLFLLAVGLVREALATGKRCGFWTGIVLMVLQLFSRMVEYDTGLLFKAIVLFLCGVGVIAAGLWFERYVRTFKPNP
ncbi:MAG: DUF2157 domain-containing protein [Xenococcaceae cyanobacterium]